MATKMRKQVYIEPDQDALLKRPDEEHGLTEALLVGTTRQFREVRGPFSPPAEIRPSPVSCSKPRTGSWGSWTPCGYRP